MKGRKIDAAKRAGIALAYKAINEKDKVGLVIFGSEIKEAISPTDDFTLLLKKLTKIAASKETNIVLAIKKATELLESDESTRHLVIITDVLPTSGEHPEKETLDAAAEARANGITISIVGITLDKKGRELGIKLAEIGGGKFYTAKNTDDIDKIVLEDYSELL
jgi:Mg-chelatase subunit ChlD